MLADERVSLVQPELLLAYCHLMVVAVPLVFVLFVCF